jgi:hypothetical protein
VAHGVGTSHNLPSAQRPADLDSPSPSMYLLHRGTMTGPLLTADFTSERDDEPAIQRGI